MQTLTFLWAHRDEILFSLGILIPAFLKLARKLGWDEKLPKLFGTIDAIMESTPEIAKTGQKLKQVWRKNANPTS